MLEKIKKMTDGKEYDFLRTNEHLGNNIIFLTLGGSHAYGTNIKSSDIDIRGCALNRKSDLIGMSSFEQVVDNETDTTIYAFNKLISLLLNMNPNICEMLGCKLEHYFLISEIGEKLIDNRKLFLSKRAIDSFDGYATAQLHRLQNNLAKHTYAQDEKELHIMSSIKRMMLSFEDKYSKFEDGNIELFIDKSDKEDLIDEIFMNINLKHYPLRDYKSIWSEMNNVVKDYGKINHRNNKKDDKSLSKHMMHLFRLYMMCIDILEKEEIITYREQEHNLLMDIRNGCFLNSDNQLHSGFYDLLNEYKNKLEYASENTSLPKSPDLKKIEEFVMSVNERVVI